MRTCYTQFLFLWSPDSSQKPFGSTYTLISKTFWQLVPEKKKKGTFMFWFRELNLTFMFHFLVKMGQKLHVVNCLGPLRLCWAFARKVLSSALFCNFHMVHLNLFTAAFTNSENVTVSNQSKYCLWFSYHIIFHDCLDNTNFHLYYWVLLISPVATCISLYSWSCLLLT